MSYMKRTLQDGSRLDGFFSSGKARARVLIRHAVSQVVGTCASSYRIAMYSSANSIRALVTFPGTGIPSMYAKVSMASKTLTSGSTEIASRPSVSARHQEMFRRVAPSHVRVTSTILVDD